MECNAKKLFLYLEGHCSEKESGEIEFHLKECSSCREKLEQMQFAIEVFSKFFGYQDREGCPSGNELVLFKNRMLDENQARDIRTHLPKCPHCRKELGIVEQFEEEEGTILKGAHSDFVLSQDVLTGIRKLKMQSVRYRMGKALKTLLERSKEKTTEERIDQFLDKYLSIDRDTLGSYALPSDALPSHRELEIPDLLLLGEMNISIANYEISIKAERGSLVVRVYREHHPVAGMEIRVESEASGTARGLTDIHGICKIEEVPGNTCRLKITEPK